MWQIQCQHVALEVEGMALYTKIKGVAISLSLEGCWQP